jgi:general secretion pathway protein H
VVFLIGLFSALVIPMVTGIGDDKLATTSRRLAGTVKYLYNESALTGDKFRLIFNLDRGTFGAKQETDGELHEVDGTGRLQTLKGDLRFSEMTVTGRGSFTSGEVTLEIESVGWIDEAVIYLTEDKREMTLRIMPFTGSTEVYEGHREF